MTEYRAHFDAAVTFVNGGGLTAEGFRLDLPDGGADENDRRPPVRAAPRACPRRQRHDHRSRHRGGAAPRQPWDREGTASPAGASRLVDLSHTIREGLVTYPGLPAPVITPHLTREDSRSKYATGTEFAMDIITMIGNTGTYIDSPFHRYEGGTDLAGLDLETLVDQLAEVFHLRDMTERGIPASAFFDRDLAGKAVLLDTGWDRHFGTQAYASGAPFLSAEGAEYLVSQGVTLVGIDSLNIDDTESGGERPAHSVLLAGGIHVVEHLAGLAQLPASGSFFSAVPPKVEAFGTFPVRAYARLP